MQISKPGCRALQCCHRAALRQPSGQPVERLATVLNAALSEPGDARGQRVNRAQPVIPIGHGEFCRTGWRRSADVSDKVGNREIDLVSYSADDRYGAVHNRPGQFLFIERPQVLQRAATAPDDQYVALVATNCGFQRGDQLGYGGIALDRRRVDDHWNRRKASTQYADNVANSGAGRGGDDTNAFGQGR